MVHSPTKMAFIFRIKSGLSEGKKWVLAGSTRVMYVKKLPKERLRALSTGLVSRLGATTDESDTSIACMKECNNLFIRVFF